VITVAGNAAINQRLLGSEGFTKEGAGALSLGPANHSFIGTITIIVGEVKIAGALPTWSDLSPWQTRRAPR
jgi:hypothetical protein